LVQTRRKIRTRLTADVVGGVLGSIARPGALIVGRYDEGGRLRVAGRTTPLPRRPGHTWPATIPSSRFGQRPSEPIDYLQVAPTTVGELDVGTSFEQHRWRHATRYIRIRPDLLATDLDPPEGSGSSRRIGWRRTVPGGQRTHRRVGGPGLADLLTESHPRRRAQPGRREFR
jgi:hypothetical protein